MHITSLFMAVSIEFLALPIIKYNQDSRVAFILDCIDKPIVNRGVKTIASVSLINIFFALRGLHIQTPLRLYK